MSGTAPVQLPDDDGADLLGLRAALTALDHVRDGARQRARRAWFEAEDRLGEHTNERVALATCLHLARVAAALDRGSEATDLARRAHEGFLQLDEPGWAARALVELAWLLPESRRRFARQALDLATRGRDDPTVAAAGLILSRILDDPEQVRRIVEETRPLATGAIADAFAGRQVEDPLLRRRLGRG
ncbi:MAG: hypothetical protein GY913_28420 [Proteobacteria bacterium]|nr:hypothetical protein [Pseudomonadota bacterium]